MRFRTAGSALVASALVLTASLSCSRDFASSSGGGDPVGGVESIESKPFSGKDVELTKLAILQLGHLFRYLDFALDYRLRDRMIMNDDSKPIALGCRNIRKVGPAYERSFDTNVEEIEVDYYKCEPEPVQTAETTSAAIRGRELVTVVYDTPYPRSSEPELTLGYPVFIGVQTSPLETELNLKTGGHLLIRRGIQLSAKRIENTETRAVYLVAMTTNDRFSQDARGGLLREGTLAVSIPEVKITVTKGESRRISAIDAGRIELSVSGRRAKKGKLLGAAGDKTSEESIETAISLVANGALAVPTSICLPAAGSYQMTKKPLAPVEVLVEANQIAVSGFDPVSAELCDEPENIYFHGEFESAYR